MADSNCSIDCASAVPTPGIRCRYGPIVPAELPMYFTHEASPTACPIAIWLATMARLA